MVWNPKLSFMKENTIIKDKPVTMSGFTIGMLLKNNTLLASFLLLALIPIAIAVPTIVLNAVDINATVNVFIIAVLKLVLVTISLYHFNENALKE